MALFDRRRVPIRVAKAKTHEAMASAREWWLVLAPSAQEARELCLAWPSKAQTSTARIINHWKKRT